MIRKQLLEKNVWKVDKIAFLYSLNVNYKESFKKKILNILYYLLSKITSKYITTLVIVAKKDI